MGENPQRIFTEELFKYVEELKDHSDKIIIIWIVGFHEIICCNYKIIFKEQ